jgi:peptidoglycan/LPS O-acetylase OafA/YrhL
MAEGRTYLRSIEGTRGIAALSILAYHTAQLSNGHGSLEAATSRFWLGVPLFFALSGFLLYRPFARAVVHERERPSVVRYARHRVLRIFPAFWLVVSVSIFQVPGLIDLYPAAMAAGAAALFAYVYLASSDLRGHSASKSRSICSCRCWRSLQPAMPEKRPRSTGVQGGWRS